MKDSIEAPVSLADLGSHHIDAHLDMHSFTQSREGVLRILELEEARYYEMLRKGEAAVRTALQTLPKDF